MRRRGAAALVLALGATTAYADAGTATITGTILDTAGAPAAGVVLTCGDALAATDDVGAYVLELPTGSCDLTVVAPGVAPIVTPVTLRAGERRTLDLEVPVATPGETIEVVDTSGHGGGETRLDGATARALPGGGGDPLKAIQSLPGVARPSAGSRGLVVWGAAPGDTQVLIDDVPVPRLYHLGGWRSLVPGELVDGLRLLPGAFNAAHGDAIGGVVEVSTALPAGDGVSARVDPLDVSVAGRGAIGAARAGAALRASVLDQLVGAVEDELAPDAGALIPVPQWLDGQAQVAVPVADGELRVLVLASREHLARVIGSVDPAAARSDVRDEHVLRAAVRYVALVEDGVVSAAAWIGHDGEALTLRYGDAPAVLDRQTPQAGGRATYAVALSPRVGVVVGVDALARTDRLHRDGSLATPAREGDVAIFGQPPGSDRAVDTWRAGRVALAPFAAVDAVLGRVTLSPGLRLVADALSTSRTLPARAGVPDVGWQGVDVAVEPRLAARVRLGAHTTVGAAAGSYHQPRDPLDTSAVFGSPTLGHEAARHLAVDGATQLGPVRLEATGYARWLDDLVARAPSAEPPPGQALTQAGSGEVLGAQLVATWIGAGDVTAWLSYGVSRSLRRDGDDVPLRRFDLDQPHLLTAAGVWRHGRWSVGGRARLASGAPRTEVIGAFLDASTGRYQPIVGATNGIRLPAFFAVDARVERTLATALGRFTASLEVQNLTARRNAEEFVYSADYADRGVLSGVPALALLGLAWESP